MTICIRDRQLNATSGQILNVQKSTEPENIERKKYGYYLGISFDVNEIYRISQSLLFIDSVIKGIMIYLHNFFVV